MNRQDLQKLSIQVADHYLKHGHTADSFQKFAKEDIMSAFPELTELDSLIVIPDKKFNAWVATGGAETTTFNYFKILVAYEMKYNLYTDKPK
jgi:hypothetical protein